MASNDDLLAQRVREVRERLGLSQDQLAQRMAARGHDFRQQTIYKIETGNRRVTWGEAISLADSLEMTIADLSAPGTSGSLGVLFERVDVLREGLEQAARTYMRAQWRLAHAADQLERLPAEDSEHVRDSLVLESPAQVLNNAGLHHWLDGEVLADGLMEPGSHGQLLMDSIVGDASALSEVRRTRDPELRNG